MGMPITVDIVGDEPGSALHEAVFSYFADVDDRFSTYKDTSETSRINAGESISMSEAMSDILALAEKTKQQTGGYFDIKKPDGTLDPSGIVKGWAIHNAAELLLGAGVKNFFIEAGGDIQAHGKNQVGNHWSVGIRNPFNKEELIKVVHLHPTSGEVHGRGIATSGSYERGAHIYNPLDPEGTLDEIVSITVIGPNILEADRFATAAFAMGASGVEFIESMPGLEAYSIDRNGIATMTSNFSKFT